MEKHVGLIKNGYLLNSPSKNLYVKLLCKKGKLFYSVVESDVQRFEPSILGVCVGKDENYYVDYSINNEIIGISENVVKDRAFTILGRKEKQVENSVKYNVVIKNGSNVYEILFVVFDNGVAFRYQFNQSAGLYVFKENTEFKLQRGSKVYASFGCRAPACNTRLNDGKDTLCYECTYAEYDPKTKFKATEYVKQKDNITSDEFYDYVLTPMTVKFKDKTFGAILESQVYNYYGINLYPFGGYRFGVNTIAGKGRFERFKVEDRVITPFRILLVEKDLNGLYSNCIINAVAERKDADFSFVKAGRSSWYWHAELMRCNPKSYDMFKEYTKTAGKMGFEYNILDGGWEYCTTTVDGEKVSGAKMLKELSDYGKKYGVGQICWCGYLTKDYMNPNSFDQRGDYRYSTKEFLDMIIEGGGVGAKVDFFRGEHNLFSGVNLYQTILEYGLDKKLVFNFHGATKPTGLSAKYPSELSREGIRGMENYFYSTICYGDIAYAFSTLTFVRGLAGHGDWTPFVHDGIGLASLVLTDSPMNAISATSEDLLNHKAKEFIKSLPTSFNQTIVLPETEFGKFISMVKERDGTFFVAGMNHTGKTYRQIISLDKFLTKGKRYMFEMWYDSPEGLRGETRFLSWYDKIVIDIPNDRGYAFRVGNLLPSYFGGEITSDVTIKNFDVEKVFYTLDDTDPSISSTAILYDGEPIKMDKSCYLRAVAFDGQQKVSAFRYRFNKIED